MTACAGENRVNDATNGSDTRIQRMMTARTEKTPSEDGADDLVKT